MVSYIAEVKKIFPSLVHFVSVSNFWRDSKTINCNLSHLQDGKPMNTIGYSQKNYLCSLNGYDLVEQFLEHYFSSYDCIGRPNMRRKFEPLV